MYLLAFRLADMSAAQKKAPYQHCLGQCVLETNDFAYDIAVGLSSTHKVLNNCQHLATQPPPLAVKVVR